MFDEKPVHLAMERIFTPLGAKDASTATVGRSRTVQAATRPRRWLMGKDGIAAAGFALAITGIGVVMLPVLTAPTTRPSPAPSMPVPVARPVLPAPAPPVAATPPAPAAAAPAADPAPVATTRRVRAWRARPANRRYVRRHARAARAYRRREAPRLTGAALRRALARDVILTRRLNREALRRLPPPPR